MPAVGSRVGAQGLMQIMPATAAYIRKMRGEGPIGKTELHNPTTNLTLAQTYLQYLADQKNGNLIDVIAAYNGGAGSVRRWHRNAVGGAERDPLLFLESIPFDETRDYVEKVLANYWLYQQRLGQRQWSLHALAAGAWPVRNAERNVTIR
jgi:soluble lytic murein transglycosylase